MDRDRAFKWGLTEESRRWRRDVVRQFPHMVDFTPAELDEYDLAKLVAQASRAVRAVRRDRRWLCRPLLLCGSR
jgi:hypothetical protein